MNLIKFKGVELSEVEEEKIFKKIQSILASHRLNFVKIKPSISSRGLLG